MEGTIKLQFGLDELEIPVFSPTPIRALIDSDYVRSRWSALGDNVAVRVNGETVTADLAVGAGCTVVLATIANGKAA